MAGTKKKKGTNSGSPSKEFKEFNRKNREETGDLSAYGAGKKIKRRKDMLKKAGEY